MRCLADVSVGEGELLLNFSFVLRVPLVVSDAVPSCDCTQVQYDHSIDSGDTLNLEVIYSPDEVGLFYRSVDLYLNVKELPVTLCIKGEVSKQ